jgi:hypothetical protein
MDNTNTVDITEFLIHINDSQSNIYEAIGRLQAEIDKMKEFLENQKNNFNIKKGTQIMD